MDVSDRTLIHQLFQARADREPERTALVIGDARVTYRELDQAANIVARRLIAAGVQPGDFVGLHLDRDALLIPGMLGVLMAGAAYVPLDRAWPQERLQLIVDDAGLSCVLTTAAHADTLAGIGVTAVPADEAGHIVGEDHTRPGLDGAPSDAAYVVYTSGSTGRPKGVVVEHGMAANLIRWCLRTWSAEELAMSLASASISFDFSVTEIYPVLAAGGVIVLAENLLALPTLPARDQVSMISGPPSGLRALLELGLPRSVGTVNCGGEALQAGLVDALFGTGSVRRVLNLYGPSECTTLSHAWDIDQSAARDEAPPIGVAVAGAEALILDADAMPVADGTTGELWIAGPGVARGYLGQPELTAQRFVQDAQVSGGRRYRTGDLVRRVNGVDHYIGRSDDQVKVRGFRVELGEIEKVLQAHPAVVDAVVVAPADGNGVRRLIAYVVPRPGVELDEGTIRGYLQSRLPEYLVPSRVGVVDDLPRASSGKVVRSALPDLEPAMSGTEYVAARSATEELVVGIIGEVLGIATVGINDDFFALGGDSLAAAAAVARLGKTLGTAVPLASFLRRSTAAGLVAEIALLGAASAGPVRHEGLTEFPLLPAQWYMWMAPTMWPGTTNTTGLSIRVTGPRSLDPIRQALGSLVRRHEILRTVVELRGDNPIAVVRPPQPVEVQEVDLRGRSATEVRAEIAAGISVAARRSFDLSKDVPLLRAIAFRTANDSVDLALIMDHFVIDGFSVGLLLDQLTTAIASAHHDRPDPNGPPPLQMGDLALWEYAKGQDEAATAEMREFWRGEITGANSPNLPGQLRTKGPTSAKRIVEPLDPHMQTRIESLRQACGVTRFAVFAAAMGILLGRRTGHAENLLGVITALRDRPGIDQVIGPIDDMIPLRIDTRGEPSFAELAHRVAIRTRSSLANQDLGITEIAKLVEAGRHPGDPLLPVFLSMQPASVPVSLHQDGVRLDLLSEIDGGNIFCDVAVLVNETVDGMEIQVGYDDERLDDTQVRALLSELLAILDAASADPHSPTQWALTAPIPT